MKHRAWEKSVSFLLPEDKAEQQRKCHPRFRSVQLLSRVWLFAIPDSTPGLPVHPQLPEFIQTQVHWVSDVIQPSHPLPSPSPPAFNLSQHQGLFQLVSSSHQVPKVLEIQLQHQSYQWLLSRENMILFGVIMREVFILNALLMKICVRVNHPQIFI